MYKTDNFVKLHLRESFPHKTPFKEERLLEKINSGSQFDYVQCNIEVPENLREAFANFPPIFKNNKVDRDDTGPLTKQDAEKDGLSTQFTRMPISRFFLENGPIITPLLLFYLDLGLGCKKSYRFVQYTPTKCFNKIVQSVVNARREEDENLNSSVVAETMK